MNGVQFIDHLIKVNRTKSDKAYLIGMVEPNNAMTFYYDYHTKERVHEVFVRVINDHTEKLAKRLVNSCKEGKEAQAYLTELNLATTARG